MKKTKKIIASVVIACSMVTITPPPFSHADWKNVAYEKNLSEYIANGVIHENILKFTDQGWLNLNVLRVDLNERDNSLQVLTHKTGLGTKGKLSELVNQNESVVGAVNGDFFNMSSSETLGPIVKDGKLVSTPFYMPDKMASFNISKDQEPFITYWTTPQLDIVNKSRPAMFTFMAINKKSDNIDTAVLFDKAWGEKSPVPPKNATNAVDFIVENNKITNIVPSKDGSIIPEDGYVILATGSFASHLQQYFMIGDEVDLQIQSTPDFNEIALTMGGGAKIVNNGTVPSVFTHEIKGNNPRTALGITKDKEEIILVTIDGRTSSYTGVSQRDLGEIMVSLGAHEAINLDGGGSTEMFLRPQGNPNKQVINNISGTTERNLMNGIGIVNTSPKSNIIEGAKLETSDSSVFVDTTRKFELKAYDKNYNPVDVDYDDIEWYVTGVKGSFDDNIFKPSTAGDAVIAAKYKGAYATMEVKVLEDPVSLTLNPSTLTINANSKRLIEVLAVDSEGYKATVNFRDLKLDIPTNLGSVDKDGYFISSSHGESGVIKASLGSLTTSLPVAVGFKETIVDDFETNNNVSFLSYPETVTGNYELSNKNKSGRYSGKLSYDLSTTNESRAAYMLFENGGIHFQQRPSRLGMYLYGDESGNPWIRAKLIDAEGTVQNIDVAPSVDWTGWKYVEFAVPTSLKAPIKLERIYAVETDPTLKTKGAIYVDDITAKYPISLPKSVENTVELPKDPREIHTELKGNNAFRFTAYGAVTNIDTLMDNLVIKKLTNLSNDSGPVSVFTDTIDSRITQNIKNTLINANEGHKTIKHEDTLFIQLNNTKGGLRESNFDQWSWFINTVDNTDAKNVFVLLPKTLSFNDKLEEKLFKDTLQKLKKDKNVDVWVLQGGKNEYKVTLDEGIRYVSLKSYPENNGIDIFKDLNYMLFTVNEDKVTYEILPMYAK